ncbi:MAG: class I SAM-dependent rRNA methyltransferase [Verrucomicrobia bacterium]|nr:class I SAM-dependent rRNA methyltransferase [Verrucomicrobiota bacterium]
MAANLKITLTPAAEHAVRAGHPWVFADRVKSQNREGTSGELAIIYDRRNRYFAVGLYDALSPIRVRILVHGDSVRVDDDWFRDRIAVAARMRDEYFADGKTTGYRWVNGESDGLPGMVLDRYGAVGVVKVYTAAWLPCLSDGRFLDWVRSSCPAASSWVLRLSRNIHGPASKAGLADGDVLLGKREDVEVTTFIENGVTFEAEPVKGQKTGFFLDQRDNRSRVRDLARDADVLNVFSHAGGFSVHAAVGGARSATDVDISKHALDAATRNMQINRAHHPGVSQCRHKTVQADAFEWLANAAKDGASYDVVVIDPPSLAKRQAESVGALEAYQRLARNGVKLLRPGGVLVAASCSAHVSAEPFFKVVRQVAWQHGDAGSELFASGHAIDHPARIPEAHYLKCLAWKTE